MKRHVWLLSAGLVLLMTSAAYAPPVGPPVGGAFTPQQGPPGEWRVEGFADLWVETINAMNSVTPFGIDPSMASDGVVDFSAGMIAMFDAPDAPGDGKADDGLYGVRLQYFRLRICDTMWDETMPGDIQFQLKDGLVTGASARLTDTMPAHPDMSLMLPASPGTWEALDQRGDVNHGTIAGTYSLRDGVVVPEPTTICLLALGALAARRKRT